MEVFKKIVGHSVSATPGLYSTMGICHNQVAFWSSVPAKNWQDGEKHYLEAIDLFKQAENHIESANTELNLQTMFQLSGQKVNLSRVKELTGILEKTGDKRAEKGRKTLEGGRDQRTEKRGKFVMFVRFEKTK